MRNCLYSLIKKKESITYFCWCKKLSKTGYDADNCEYPGQKTSDVFPKVIMLFIYILSLYDVMFILIEWLLHCCCFCLLKKYIS